MVNDDLVSMIVPVYCMEPYLRRCVDSLTAQTYPKVEIILVDDGSTDLSGAICDEYAAADDRVRVVHQPNAGVSVARNVGIEAASGRWLAFVDPDDWVSGGFLCVAVCDSCEFAHPFVVPKNSQETPLT